MVVALAAGAHVTVGPELTTTAASVSAGSTEDTASADVLARVLGGIAVLRAAAGFVVSLRRRSGMTS